MTSSRKFYLWLLVLFVMTFLLAVKMTKGATRTYAIKNTAHAITLDSAKLFWGYLGSATVVDSSAGSARGASPQNYDTTITLDNADSSYWVSYRLWLTNDSAVDYRLPDILPIASNLSLTGDGPARDTIFVLDTSGVDVTAGAGVEVHIRNSSNTVVGWGTTNAAGKIVFGTRVGDTYNAFGFSPTGGFAFPDSVSFTGTGGGIDTLRGYDISAVASTTDKTCNVRITIKDNAANPVEGVPVTAYLVRSNIKDSAGTAIANVPQRKKTNSNGQVTFTCIWSSYLIPATKWRFQGHSPAIGGFRKDYTVPRQASVDLDLSQ